MDKVWEELHSTQEWGKYPADELIRFVKRKYKKQSVSGVKVLEVGCGAGANLFFFLNEGFDAYGIDGSESAIKKCHQRLGHLVKAPQVLDLVVGNFVKLPWQDNSFDIVVDYLAIYANSMKDIKNVTEEVYRVLKPGGIFFSRSWSVGTTGEDTGEVFETGTSRNPTKGPCRDCGTSHFFTQDELKKLFSQFTNLQLTRLTTEKLNEDFKSIEWIVTAVKA